MGLVSNVVSLSNKDRGDLRIDVVGSYPKPTETFLVLERKNGNPPSLPVENLVFTILELSFMVHVHEDGYTLKPLIDGKERPL